MAGIYATVDGDALVSVNTVIRILSADTSIENCSAGMYEKKEHEGKDCL